jgi:hypothetical protein
MHVRYREVEARLAVIEAEIGADSDARGVQTIEGFAEP